MAFRTLRSRNFYALLKPQYLSRLQGKLPHIPSTATHHILSNSDKSSSFYSTSNASTSISAQFEANSINFNDINEHNTKSKKPLHVLFKEAVGLSEKHEHSDIDAGVGANEFKKKLKKLEDDVRRLKASNGEDENGKNLTAATKKKKTKDEEKKTSFRNDDGFSKDESSSKSLYALFTNKVADVEKSRDAVESLGMEDPVTVVYKELSTEMIMFVTHLHKEGYFDNANFMPRNKFDVTCFENSYGRDFIKYAAEMFGKDNQEIAKWLSASDLKKVALFGCPSLGRKTIFSAKRLRYFFRIQEDAVCSKCVLKPSCKFPNQSVWRGDDKKLNLAVVMRVIILYALESVPPQLVVPNEIKDSVSRLLKEVMSLSETPLA